MDQNKQPQQTSAPDPQVAPTPGQKVQYVVTQQSLNGIGGWLLFFLIIFGLIGIGGISIFFTTLEEGVSTAVQTMDVVFSPLMVVGFLGSLILVAMRKKAALMAVYATFATMAVYGALVSLVSTESEDTLAFKVSSAIVSFVFFGLWALYFKQSRRIKETLVK